MGHVAEIIALQQEQVVKNENRRALACWLLALRLCWPAGLSPSVQTLSLSITPAQTAAWRKQIFQQLTERTKRELENFRHYEQAVEQVGSSWMHSLSTYCVLTRRGNREVAIPLSVPLRGEAVLPRSCRFKAEDRVIPFVLHPEELIPLCSRCSLSPGDPDTEAASEGGVGEGSAVVPFPPEGTPRAKMVWLH